MNDREPRRPAETDAQKDHYEKQLWKRAEDLAVQKGTLALQKDAIYQEVENLRKQSPNLHDIEVLRDREGLYWKIDKELQSSIEEENAVQEALLHLEGGTVASEELAALIRESAHAAERISKRKQRILEYRRLLEKSHGFDAELDNPPPPPTTHLSTGRRATAVKGNMEQKSAAEVFYRQTTDTHGGKIRKAGKKGGRGASWMKKRLLDSPAGKKDK